MSVFYTVKIRFHPHMSSTAQSIDVVREDNRPLMKAEREAAVDVARSILKKGGE